MSNNTLDSDQKFTLKVIMLIILGVVLIIGVSSGAYLYHNKQMIDNGFKLERQQYWGDTYWTK